MLYIIWVLFMINVNNDNSEWSEIKFLGNWEVQGHGIAKYTNIVYDFCPSNPKPPYLSDLNPVGVYRRKNIEIPKSWIDQERYIFIQVGGAKTGLYVYVNGQEVGYSEDSKDPADFLINKYIHQGKDNVITFVIYKYSKGSYLEDQDMWRLGGIERDVVLYSQPKTHIRDFKIVSTLDDSYTNGILIIGLELTSLILSFNWAIFITSNIKVKTDITLVNYDLLIKLCIC